MQKRSGSSVSRAGSRGGQQGKQSNIDVRRITKLLFDGMAEGLKPRTDHGDRVQSMIDQRCELVTQWDTHPREGSVWLYRIKHTDHFLVHTQETWQIGLNVVRPMTTDDESLDCPLRERRSRFEIIGRREAAKRFLRFVQGVDLLFTSSELQKLEVK